MSTDRLPRLRPRQRGWSRAGRSGAFKSAQHMGILYNWETEPVGFTSDAYCLDFNGTDEYIEGAVDVASPMVTDITTSMSMGAWFKTSTTVTDVIASLFFGANGRRFQLNIQSSGAVRASVKTDTGTTTVDTSTTTLADGAWHLAVGTLDGGSVRVYIDNSGLDGGPTARSGTMNDASNEFDTIRQGLASGGTNQYLGRIASVFVHSAALSATDVTGLYNAGGVPDLTIAASYDTAGMEDNLVGWWRNGDGSNDIADVAVYDQSGVATTTTFGTFTNMDATNFVEDAPA